MEERGNCWNLPGKHNCVMWSLGPRKSLSITPHIDVPVGRRWLFRIEGTYIFFLHRKFTSEEWAERLQAIRDGFAERVEDTLMGGGEDEV